MEQPLRATAKGNCRCRRGLTPIPRMQAQLTWVTLIENSFDHYIWQNRAENLTPRKFLGRAELGTGSS